MSLYQQWEELIKSKKKKPDYAKFIQDYLQREKEIYEEILENYPQIVKGTCEELAKKYNMSNLEFVGFLDGINTSLKDELDLDEIKEDTNITLDIDYAKLYWNMVDAQAKWLYEISAWDKILTKEQRKQIRNDINKSKTVVKPKKIGRNEPCPCGSGLKYKKCCGK
ncbi:SEC-C metal-binding domain-containing protein [Defluviitalea phaphyphila]|uniref:SEC-C metal-binding domain-containing protein n=1 Tax=Defluviitalea phaphyphila TaxID=1473580 RepID=UPI0007305AD0|nr:SEC-C metal-binding domain-containing protein [Defluviitalea phaphyphila]